MPPALLPSLEGDLRCKGQLSISDLASGLYGGCACPLERPVG